MRDPRGHFLFDLLRFSNDLARTASQWFVALALLLLRMEKVVDRLNLLVLLATT